MNLKIVLPLIVAIIAIGGISIGIISKYSNNQSDDEPSANDDNCIILSARALHEMMYYNITDQINSSSDDDIIQVNLTTEKDILFLLYPNFSDGECIIIQDNISLIQYYPNVNYTSVVFSWYKDQYTKPHVYYHFKGNITDEYKKGDTVEILLHLKHVELETKNMMYTIDIFEEQWVSNQYFIENVASIDIDKGLKAMDQNGITKI